MMNNIHIPPAALDAGARAVLRAIIYDIEPDVRANGLTDEEQAIIARAAFLAMIEAWPGMNAKAATDHVMLLNSTPALILPLMEKQDAEA